MEYILKGKYCKDCKIYAKTVEEKAYSQVYELCNSKAFNNQKIRVMCDVHCGQGIVIGFSSTIDKENPMVNPSHVGVDIGCQVTCIKMSKPCPEQSYALLEHRLANYGLVPELANLLRHSMAPFYPLDWKQTLQCECQYA